MIKVEIAIEQSEYNFDSELLRKAVRIVLEGELVEHGDISVAVVDDATMHLLNLKYLQHDYATDVLSFLLSTAAEPLEGEVIVSADTAAREAIRYGWDKTDELLLYLIHGTLHLLGHDDVSEPERQAMRDKERLYLAQLGRHPNYDVRLPTIRASSSTDSDDEGETQS